MGLLKIFLFGRFQVTCDGQAVTGFDSLKVQELFAYLLLNRGAQQPRETLAGQLWGESTAPQSRKYLRQTLWQLHTALDAHVDLPEHTLLAADANFLRVNPQNSFWLDVHAFEQSCTPSQGLAGRDLNEIQMETLHNGLQLYRGDLLDGWYQDWCLFERERLQNLYLSVLDKLMSYCECHHLYERGMQYAATILKYDRAREYTHQGLMRLLYQSGDRTGALRQYERCVNILAQELNVGPSESTLKLHAQILKENSGEIALQGNPDDALVNESPTSLPAALIALKKFQTMLSNLQSQLQQEIQSIEHGLSQPEPPTTPLPSVHSDRRQIKP